MLGEYFTSKTSNLMKYITFCLQVSIVRLGGMMNNDAEVNT